MVPGYRPGITSVWSVLRYGPLVHSESTARFWTSDLQYEKDKKTKQMTQPQRPALEDLIRVCLERGLIERCKLVEGEEFWVRRDAVAFGLSAEQLRNFLETLLSEVET